VRDRFVSGGLADREAVVFLNLHQPRSGSIHPTNGDPTREPSRTHAENLLVHLLEPLVHLRAVDREVVKRLEVSSGLGDRSVRQTGSLGNEVDLSRAISEVPKSSRGICDDSPHPFGSRRHHA
jgi:hypothetical protein